MNLTGRWRIVAMDGFESEAVDLVQPAFIEFGRDGLGSVGFVALQGQIDYRITERDGHECFEFTWEGDDEGDAVSGRGWAAPKGDGALEGHLFTHLGDDSGFRAVPFDHADEATRP